MSEPGPRRILVVAPAWVGDLVMCQSLLRVLRDRYPTTPVDVLAPAWAGPLLSRMPEVSEALASPAGHGELRPLRQLRSAREAARRGYDWAIVTPRSLKSAMVPFLARIPRRTGVLGESRYLLVNDVRRIRSETHPEAVVRLAALGMEAGARPRLADVPRPRLRVDEERGAALEERLGLAGDGPVVGLAPGAAYGPAKRWPLEHWSGLAGRLTERGARVWVFGSEAEAADGERVAAEAGPGAWSLCGRTRLDDVVDLMARCRTVVSNDSGLMHLAAASGSGVVAIFGSSSPKNTPPLGDGARVLWLELECSPCFRRECPLGHLRCLRELGVEAVLSEIDLT